MLTYHNIDPVAINLGVIKIHWYGLMYLAAFFVAWWIAKVRVKSSGFLSSQQISDLIFYGVIGVILGGRFGYVLFYHPEYLINDPLEVFYIWHGGMSFHGGFIGVVLALIIFAYTRRKLFLSVLDLLALMAPLGLGLGRIGNFIGGELWGRPTDLPWGMIFPRADSLMRHPSQLYQAFLEGLVLFIIVWCFAAKKRPAGSIAGLAVTLYAIFRFAVEFVREPDAHLGFIAFGWLTNGQLLTIPLFGGGVLLMIYAYVKNNSSSK